MAVTLESLGIDRLSAGDRLELIELIWDSLPDAPTPDDVPAWHLTELAARRTRAESEPGVGRPWRDVLDDLGSGR